MPKATIGLVAYRLEHDLEPKCLEHNLERSPSPPRPRRGVVGLILDNHTSTPNYEAQRPSGQALRVFAC